MSIVLQSFNSFPHDFAGKRGLPGGPGPIGPPGYCRFCDALAQQANRQSSNWLKAKDSKSEEDQIIKYTAAVMRDHVIKVYEITVHRFLA